MVVALSCACALDAAHSNRALNTPPIWLRFEWIIKFLPEPLAADSPGGYISAKAQEFNGESMSWR